MLNFIQKLCLKDELFVIFYVDFILFAVSEIEVLVLIVFGLLEFVASVLMFEPLEVIINRDIFASL